MVQPVVMAELWRGDMLESIHRGHAVVFDASGQVRAAWGNPDQIILPRSSCKMLQALPLVESGAAQAAHLTTEHLALACASHQGAPIHADRVEAWLHGIDRSEQDLRCGSQPPSTSADRQIMRDHGGSPSQLHNNCSGKHAGFVTLAKHLGAGPEYIDLTHPVQIAVKAAFEEMTEETSPGFGVDGCSAPNFATSISGLGRAMANMTKPASDTRSRAATQLVDAMLKHPMLVAGEGRACTELMGVMDAVAVKTGAEGVFVAIAKAQGLGVALKIEDGATRASEAAMAAILVHLNLLDPNHPLAQKRLNAVQPNRRGLPAAHLRATDFTSH